MDLQGGAPFWFLKHGLRTVVPPLEESLRCDLAIIGSGITGALIAHTLAPTSRSIVLLDARDLAQGSTMASTALLQYDLDVPLHRLADRLGFPRAARAFTIGAQAIDSLAAVARSVGAPFQHVPSLYFTSDAASVTDLRAEFEHRTRAGLDVRWLEPPALRRQWGVHAEAAILSTASAQTDPYDLTHRLLADAQRHGVRIHDRTRVAAVTTHADSVELLTDRGHTISADVLIHATGYEATKSLPPDLVRLVSTFAMISEPVTQPPDRPRCQIWEFADPYLYARWAGDRILVGGEDEPFRYPEHRDALIATKARTLAARLAQVLPEPAIEPAFAWAGTFGTTDDGLGYIGSPPDRPREIFALGFGGNGITCSMIAATLVADRLRGAKNPDAELFAFGR